MEGVPKELRENIKLEDRRRSLEDRKAAFLKTRAKKQQA